jgi:hydroxyethylthiazole kinase-like uncharacterized protein yjeF
MPPSPPAEARLDPTALRSYPLPADQHDDKRGRGTVLVIGGSPTTPGAALLAGIAALRAGAGRLQIATAADAVTPLAIAVPEALVTSYDDESDGLLRGLIASADSVVVGPGLSDPDRAAALVAAVLEGAARGAVVVIDALGLDALAARRDPVPDRFPVIVTPNREELARLACPPQTASSSEHAAARKHGVTVVSFGRVVTPDGRSWTDTAEVRGLGTSGAGDVLAGAIGGIAARSHDVVTAALWATLGHRFAADRLAADMSSGGYLARELLDELPRALVQLSALAR